MRYLREGLLCLKEVEGGTALYDLAVSEVHRLEPEAAEAAWSLLAGLSGREAIVATKALGEEFTQERDEPFDPILRQHLEGLDEPMTWLTSRDTRWLVELCEQAHSALTHIRDDLDQLPVLPETAARRALLLHKRLGRGAKVALVGDDDLLGIALAALGLRPTVLDIDKDLLVVYRQILSKLDYEVDLRYVDLREPLSGELIGQFDAFCTDPETSRECVCLFLSRGVSLVRPGGVGMVACAEEWVHLVEAALDEMGVHTERLLRRFANYRNSRVKLAAYRSDLFLVSVPSEARPLVDPVEQFEGYLFPFGLTGEDHLIATVHGCDPRRLRGPELTELAARLVSEGSSLPIVEDRSPFPVRLVTASGDHCSIQFTVHSNGTSADLDMRPAPEDSDVAQELGQKLADSLGAHKLRLQTLRRLE